MQNKGNLITIVLWNCYLWKSLKMAISHQNGSIKIRAALLSLLLPLRKTFIVKPLTVNSPPRGCILQSGGPLSPPAEVSGSICLRCIWINKEVWMPSAKLQRDFSTGSRTLHITDIYTQWTFTVHYRHPALYGCTLLRHLSQFMETYQKHLT